MADGQPVPLGADPHVRANERAFLREALVTEANAVRNFADRVAADEELGLHAALDLLEACRGHVVVSGMGKSGLVGAKISASLSSLGQPSHFVHPAEAVHGDLGMVTSSDVVLAFSNSGETEEIVRILPFFQDSRVPVISIVGKSESTLGRNSTVSIAYTLESEACPHNLAPTTSTTLSLAIGDAIAIALMMNRSFEPIDFARFHPGGSLGRRLLLRVSDVMLECPIVQPDLNLFELTKIMIEAKSQICAVATCDQVLIGAVTYGDISRSLFRTEDDINPVSIQVSDIMSPSPHVIDRDVKCAEADEYIFSNKVNSLIVTEGKIVLGAYYPNSWK